jgi:hypothetical protein
MFVRSNQVHILMACQLHIQHCMQDYIGVISEYMAFKVSWVCSNNDNVPSLNLDKKLSYILLSRKKCSKHECK